MVIWPEYQKKAQTELDRIVGRDRLPDFADLAALPYVEAIIRETYRKYPVTPLGTLRALPTVHAQTPFRRAACRRKGRRVSRNADKEGRDSPR